ncbi:hypothetical protein B0H66DRAFT_574759 [Apodospora peruviana]|uniref:DUF8021 domain-containing protein n=1 Tax=Apodospora peruviana TaxID=516989 RepID=A0AAE0ICS1_9PEZI|nr:hypothetical protein B0H66DRAFT_574759 [Apodospora peruviana]
MFPTSTILALALGLNIHQSSAACSEALLREATERYVATQSTGNLSWFSSLLSPNATYVENGKTLTGWTSSSLASSNLTTTLSTPFRIDNTHSIYDLTQCGSFTALVVTDPSNPHVIGAQVRLGTDNKISKIDRIVTTPGDWLFNATGTLYYTLQEHWDVIPVEKRDSREVIKAAADAYLDIFKNASVQVPWGSPCARLEGGAYTGRGLPTDSCNVGVIQSYDMPNRRYIIDESVGVASLLLEFGSIGNAPDSHLFRVEGGRLRFIHTMTYCEKKPNSGTTPAHETPFPLPYKHRFSQETSHTAIDSGKLGIPSALP